MGRALHFFQPHRAMTQPLTGLRRAFVLYATLPCRAFIDRPFPAACLDLPLCWFFFFYPAAAGVAFLPRSAGRSHLTCHLAKPFALAFSPGPELPNRLRRKGYQTFFPRPRPR